MKVLSLSWVAIYGVSAQTDEDLILELLDDGVGQALDGDLDGDGVLSAAEIAMKTAEEWAVPGIEAFRTQSRRRNKRCDTCCPPPLFYYSIESLGKWEYDPSDPNSQEVPPITNMPYPAPSAYGDWYDGAGFHNAMTPKTGSPDMTRCLCMRPLPQDQCDRAAGEQCDLDDSYKVQRGNCDPRCMDSSDRWSCEHNERAELAEAEDSIPYVEDPNARMRYNGYAAECLPPLPHENDYGVATCAKPWITKGQLREHRASAASVETYFYSEFHDVMMKESYKLNSELTTAQLMTVGLQEADRLTSFEFKQVGQADVVYTNSKALADAIDDLWFGLPIREGYWYRDGTTNEVRRDEELNNTCIEPTPQAKHCYLDSGSFSARVSGVVVGVAGVLTAFYLL